MPSGPEDKQRNFLEALGESIFLLTDDELSQELEDEGTTLKKAAADFDALFLGSLKSLTIKEREHFQEESRQGSPSSPAHQQHDGSFSTNPLQFLRELVAGRPELVCQFRNFEELTDEEAVDAIQDIMELIELEDG